MPNDGDRKYFKIPGFLNDVEYIWHSNEPNYPDGWWTDPANDPLDYGGNGSEPVAHTPEPTPAKPSDAALLYEAENPGETWPPTTKDKDGNSIPDKAEMRYWQSEVFRQRKAEEDTKAKTTEAARVEAAKAAETTRLEAAKAAETKRLEAEKKANQQTSVGDTLGEAFKRGQQSGDFTEYQQLLAASKPPPAPAKTPTIDELIVEAILSGNSEAAMSLWNFAAMPSQAERLRMAIAASQSPADYLATVGMMRGEIPIPQQPAGSYRLGPESQAFAAYGVGGQGGGGSSNPLQDPALQNFITSRGGGGPATQTATPDGGGAMATYQASLDVARNQTGTDGLTQEQRIRRQAGLQNPNGTNNNVPTAPGAIGQNPALDLIDRQIAALVSASDTAPTQEEQASIQQKVTQLQQQRQQVWQSQQSTQAPLASSQATGGETTGPNGEPIDSTTFPGRTGYWTKEGGAQLWNEVTGPVATRKGPAPTKGTAAPIKKYEATPTGTAQPGAGDVGGGTWNAGGGYVSTGGGGTPRYNPDIAIYQNRLANTTDPNERAKIQETLRQLQNPATYGGPGVASQYANSRGGQMANQSAQDLATGANLPSFLKDAYGKEVLSGAALKTRMSYPELGARQGVTIPRFRSAQARSMQTPLEQRMFEAGLQQQGIDVPTYLWQEGQGTTPGGSRRRRVTTGY